MADRILVSRPLSETGRYTAPFDAYCASTPVLFRDGSRFDVECFAPEVDATEGETTPVTRIARERECSSRLMATSKL